MCADPCGDDAVTVGECPECGAVQCWEVRWNSRFNEYPESRRPEVRVFTDVDKAIGFRDSLLDAYDLIMYSSGKLSVSLEKQ